jgi:polysaccharide export outer membrane protein
MVMAGCTINRDIMFKTPTDHAFDTFQDSASDQLTLQANDVFQFRLFANDGFKIIDLVTEGAMRDVQFMNRATFQYFIEFDGMAKLPLLGRVALKGMSAREAEIMLEEQYSRYYNRPFVQLIVSNRRVVVFPGGGGDAKVIPLENSNTTLLEVLATAGGLAKRGNASKVKLFRHGPDGKRLVHLFDLSTIEGLKYADVVMQGDDVLYVEPNPELAREFLQDLTPIGTLLTSIVLVIGIVRGFN